MTMHTLLRLVVFLTVLLGIAGGANGQEATDTPKAPIPFDQAAHVRFALFSVDPDMVDFYLDGELTDAKGLEYPAITDWITVPAGSHRLAVTAAGETVSGALLGPLDVELPPMTWTTVAV